MANISPEVVEERIARFGKLYMIDDLIRERGKDAEQSPILGFPSYRDSASDYEYFTGRDLDRMVDEACRALVREGFEVNSGKTVALFAPSDLSFVVTFFALFRLGCKVLAMSIRLGPPACLTLLDRAECQTVLCGDTSRIQAVVASLRETRPDIDFRPMLQRETFDQPGASPQPPFERPIADREAEHCRVALIAHSSGSTGLPKPLFLSHRGLLHTRLSGTGLRAFNALPWYHLHGLITSIQAMWMRQPAHLFNPNLPLTAENLVSALQKIQPEICHTVPYTLKLMAELPAGVEVLKQCKIVTSAGARTPDELGDRLVRDGVPLAVIFGLTEVGHMGDSISREPGDTATWAYVRPFGNVRPHMFFKKVGDETYESVYLKSHPALMMSNSNDPPGSFHSKDLFTPHPTLPNAWKYVARDDDRITLLNGEKILPLKMEGTVRESPLVRDALMVGIDKPVPGMVVFRSRAAEHMSDDDFARAIGPSIEEANRIADEFARIVPEMVLPMPADVDYPCTDKNNIIRAQAYKKFAADIEALYVRLEEGRGAANGTKKRVLSMPDLEQYLMELFGDRAGVVLQDVTTDFFAAGVDSLRAMQVRRLLQEELDIQGSVLPTNVVYDAGNVERLAKMLSTLQSGQQLNGDHVADDLMVMEDLIKEYSDFAPFRPGPQPIPEKDVVILTGATGALGAHVLNYLLQDPDVKHVYCLARGPNSVERVQASLKARGIDYTSDDLLQDKLKVLETSSLDTANLGLSMDAYGRLQSRTTLVIHAAWPVNFNVSLKGFEPQIVGLSNLLKLSLAVAFSKPARLLFASSISTAFRMAAPDTDITATIPEGPLPSLDCAAATGYARSKLIGERLCEAAASAGGRIGVLRIGQIAGDTQKGIWNDKEAIPLMIRSALEVGTLPLLEGRNGDCQWMPVDVVAKACLEIATSLVPEKSVNADASDGHSVQSNRTTNGVVSSKASYFNILPEGSISWSTDVLPALQAGGLKCETVSFSTWLSMIRRAADELGVDAGGRLPAIKLAEYYEEEYGNSSSSLDQGIHFQTNKSHLASPALKHSSGVLYPGLIRLFLQSWLGLWRA